MKVTRMPLKRLLTSAAILMLGCSDAATDGVDVPPYAGNWTPPNTSGAQPVNDAPDPGGVQPTDGTNGGVTPAGGGRADVPPANNQQPSNEGQNTGDVPLEGGNVDNSGGDQGSNGTGTGNGDGYGDGTGAPPGDGATEG